MTILLMGYMGSGKTTIGKMLSDVLEYSFIDLDSYIEAKEGKTVSDIFASKGEIYFRKKESQYLTELLNNDNAVVSLGGGTPCYGNNIKLMNTGNHNKTVYLKASIQELSKRLFSERTKRPLISNISSEDDLTEFIAKHIFERASFYEQAHVTIQTHQKSKTEIVEEIVKELF